MGDVLKLGPRDSLEIVSSTPRALEVEARYLPEGSPPPAHLHPEQDEHFEVLEGEIAVRVEGAEARFAAGEELDVPRAAVHQIWNPASAPARVRWVTSPAGRTEAWFRVLDSIFAAPPGAPPKVDFAELLEEYADVFRIADAG